MTETGPGQVFRGSLDRLISKIHDSGGIDLSHYRRAYLERRVAARLRTLDLHSYRQYADLLDRDPSEYNKFLDTLTINVTEFFRDQTVWAMLRRQVIPSILATKSEGRSRTIRCWSAGCATDEEPYSLAMSLLDAIGDEPRRYLVSVVGTDLDKEALAVAEKGVYPGDALKGLPVGFRKKYTLDIDRSSVQVRPEVQKLVRFQHFSLFDVSPMRVVDLILCRNVFIYLNRDQQAVVLENFMTSLARGGYLVLGRSEKLSPSVADRLEVVNGRERIYRKPPRF